jgi:glycosyltransferase involved in cell wall biosynthesis
MVLAYLVNQYPKISHTFIRREIAALERQGTPIHRYSIRPCPDRLIDPLDLEEQRKTTVILEAGAGGLSAALARVAAAHPARFARAARLAGRIGLHSERGLARHMAYLAEACVLLGSFAERGVTHVHAHFGSNATAVAMLCHELGGPPYSFTAHGYEEFDKAALWGLRDKIERAAFVVGISSFGKSQIYRHCDPADWPKVHVVRCGVEPSLLAGEPAAVPEAPRLLCVGRLSPEKGQLVLMDAATRLHRAGRDFQLTLVGDGEVRPAIEAAIRDGGLGGKVTITGWVDGDAVRRAYDECRALVVPSLIEGLPVVLMEALARGRPAVSSAVAGVPELLEPGKSGWLVPAGDPEALAAAMGESLATPAARRAEMGAHGRRRVREQHDLEQIGRTLRGLFERGR